MYNQREKATNQADQDKFANMEHRAFAREVVGDNPLMAVPLLAAIPAYQAAKAVGLTNSRSHASVEQASEAYKGVGEGLMKPWEKTWNNVKEAVDGAVDTAKTAVASAGGLPWMREFGKDTPAVPKQVEPTVSRFDQIFDKLINAESKGKHTDAQGYLIASGKGAQGITQLMPATAGDPGYGVQPIKNKTKAEYIRFGKEYLGAMVKEFDGDYEKALAAYNAGVGNVKKAIEAGGKDWKDHLPKKSETLPYINKILGKN